MEPKAKKLLLFSFVSLAIIFIASTLISVYNHKKGALILDLYELNTNNISDQLNNKPFRITGLISKYNLHEGSYTLSISQPGYAVSTARFNIHTNKTITLNIVPIPKNLTTPLSLKNIYLTAATKTNPHPKRLTSILPSNASFNNSIGYNNQTFYSNSWAVIYITFPGDATFDVGVVTYDVNSNSWYIVVPVQPYNSFSIKGSKALPLTVSNFVRTTFPLSGESSNLVFSQSANNWTDPD